MTTGERIRSRRKQLGISAEMLADHLGVSATTIYRYENGAIEKMPADILIPIADFLATTPAALMGWADEPDGTEKQLPEVGELSQAQRDLIALVERLPEDICAAMLIALRQQFPPDDPGEK